MQRYQVGDEPKKGFVVTEVIPGGMGVVYLVEFTHGGASIKRAIKSCDVEKGLAPDFREKLEKESLLWISLEPHPYVVKAHTFELDGGLPNLTMEYLPGGNLRDRIDKGPMPLSDTLRIAVEFCDGMRFLTDDNGICHLDIKPENVLFDGDGHIKITDFGLARAYEDVDNEEHGTNPSVSSTSEVPQTHRVIAGTLPYMAPERLASASDVDTRADVYSFGVMLYEMLTGRRPFDATDAASFEKAIANASIAPLPETIPEHLREIVFSCLSDDPRKRVPGFNDLLSGISQICEQCDVTVELSRSHSDDETEGALDAFDWSNRGYALVQANQFDEALRCYRRGISVLEAEPRSDNFMMRPGVDKKVNASDAASATLHTNMGALLMRMGRVSEAKAAFETALAVVPNDGVAHLRLGQIAIHEGRVSEGLSLLKRSTQCEPGNFDLLLMYLRACLEHGEEEGAERSFAEFLDGKKSDGPFLVSVGCLLDDEFGLDPALRCFDAALEYDEDLSIAWYNKGVALHRAGESAKAIESYQSAIRLDRRHPFARCYLGVLLIRQGQMEEGLANLKRFLEQAAPSPLTELIGMTLQGAELGMPLTQLLEMFSVPQAVKHVV